MNVKASLFIMTNGCMRRFALALVAGFFLLGGCLSLPRTGEFYLSTRDCDDMRHWMLHKSDFFGFLVPVYRLSSLVYALNEVSVAPVTDTLLLPVDWALNRNGSCIAVTNQYGEAEADAIVECCYRRWSGNRWERSVRATTDENGVCRLPISLSAVNVESLVAGIGIAYEPSVYSKANGTLAIDAKADVACTLGCRRKSDIFYLEHPFRLLERDVKCVQGILPLDVDAVRRIELGFDACRGCWVTRLDGKVDYDFTVLLEVEIRDGRVASFTPIEITARGEGNGFVWERNSRSTEEAVHRTAPSTGYDRTLSLPDEFAGSHCVFRIRSDKTDYRGNSMTLHGYIRIPSDYRRESWPACDWGVVYTNGRSGDARVDDR